MPDMNANTIATSLIAEREKTRSRMSGYERIDMAMNAMATTSAAIQPTGGAEFAAPIPMRRHSLGSPDSPARDASRAQPYSARAMIMKIMVLLTAIAGIDVILTC